MKPQLDYLELHAAHHCNLNCKGCGHYSNIAEPEFPTLSEFERDSARLKELIIHIRKIRLLGGEPLLNPELPQMIQIMHDAFPQSDIRIATNGLLIPNADEQLFKAMRDYEVRFDISLYPPTKKLMKIIQEVCAEQSVQYTFSPEITEFYNFGDTSVPQEPEQIYNSCWAKHCHMMLDGKIAVCPKPLIRYKFSGLGWEHFFEEDVIDLYDETLTPDVLLRRLNQPCRLCQYCDPHTEPFEWEGNYKTGPFRRDNA